MHQSIKVVSILATLLLTAQTAPPAPPAPLSETIKRRALLIGYWLNGDSMVRPPSMGSIDVSEIVHIPDRPSITTIPPR